MADSLVRVAGLGEIPPGTMKRVEIGGRRILLANVAGEVFAADDSCTHEDASLVMGCLQGETVKCPLHGSRFDLRTGAALDEPAEEPLRTYTVRVDKEDVLVDLARSMEHA